ncbi:MAG: hypothetical protein HY220_00005, partial [Candidatus Sungbacteria bacterium]|nr:hypothetical protein [Candidatus Sungbacteria bacterium]
MASKNLLDVLASNGALSLEDVSKVKAEAKRKGVAPEDVLYEKGLDEYIVLDAKSEIFGVPVKKLAGTKSAFGLLKSIPEESARFYKFVPIGESADGYFEVGMVHPDDVSAQQALKFISARLQKPLRIFLISPSDFKSIIGEYKSIGGEVNRALTEFERESQSDISFAALEANKVDENILTEEGPITKIVDVIVKHGVEGRASDIHIEPSRT